MMLMHAIHGNGKLIIRANGNIAEVSSGVYTVNGQERIRKSSNTYKNQNRIHKLMIGLMHKYGSFEYEGKQYLLKGMDHWQSDGTYKLVANEELKRSIKWG
ncbi:hypothetical protein CLV90_3197 [Maribacter spongiicola]|uniref:Uncharacterized protein n=1 Tax=Maribacter spongiicola TaxID=1206753 RepID=A0A4R7JVS3_9FLAO|nr:hypothetical protein [Maribacter spongiicola]TDT41964.1 hypothetical protein CLV90_3197 [Maribacter spongiicola]